MPAPQPLITAQHNFQWKNRHQNVSITAGTFYEIYNLWRDAPAPPRNDFRPGLQSMRAVVAAAERDDKRIRAVGGTWSLSEAAACADVMVNTRPLNFMELGLRPDSLCATFKGDRKRLCFTQCGASVLELYRYLEPRGYTLPTGGASNGQTIAGAISTGTHGAAHGVGAMQDFVVGVHVVAEGGKTYWIERKSRPVVSQAFCRKLGATLRRDDDELFNAAVVSFGSFGMVHAYLLEVEPLYFLEHHVKRMDYYKARASLASFDISTLGLAKKQELPFHYEVIVNPYRAGTGEGGAFVRYMYRRSRRSLTPQEHAKTGYTQGDDAMSFLANVSSVLPDAIPVLLDHVLAGQFSDHKPILGSPGQQFGPTEVRGHLMSTELGVPQALAGDATDAIIAVAKQFPFPGFPALRFVKASSATLAFTHFAPVTCTIEIPGAGGDRTRQAFERIWVELHRRQIPFTLHWGQCMRAAATHGESAYGDRIARWLAQRKKFLSPKGQRTFSSDWLAKQGLCD